MILPRHYCIRHVLITKSLILIGGTTVVRSDPNALLPVRGCSVYSPPETVDVHIPPHALCRLSLAVPEKRFTRRRKSAVTVCRTLQHLCRV
jgi:hypothetical protein